MENVTSLTKVKLHECKEEKNDKDKGDLLHNPTLQDRR